MKGKVEVVNGVSPNNGAGDLLFQNQIVARDFRYGSVKQADRSLSAH